MALVKATLKAAMELIFNGTADTSTTAKAAEAWAAAYKNYAATATDCAAGTPNPASLTAAETTLKTALQAAFDAGVAGGTSAASAAALAAAYTAFWFAPPIAFLPSAGIVTVVGGTAILQAALIAFWAANSADGQAPAAATVGDDHANALDAFTKTVVVSVAAIPCVAPLV